MITVKMKGLEQAVVRLNRLGDINTYELMHQLALITRRQTVDHFTKGAGPDGAWAPLSAATKSINPRRGSGKPLTDTGRLKGSIDARATSRSAEIGTNVHYGKYHQYGAELNMFGRGIRATLPQRRFLGWDAGEMAALNRAVKAFVAAQIG